MVYEELRKLAAAKLSKEKPGQTLQATALVHVAYVRLVDVETVKKWDSRGHFFAAAAEAMRRMFVERARQKLGLRRRGRRARLQLDPSMALADDRVEEILFIHPALENLAAESPAKAELAKLLYFRGLSYQEAAETLKLNPGWLIEVAGHTDSVGDEVDNQGLSDRRAKTVYDFLIKYGVDESRLTFRGYGEMSPIASNDTASGRAMNRRVELRVAKP